MGADGNFVQYLSMARQPAHAVARRSAGLRSRRAADRLGQIELLRGKGRRCTVADAELAENILDVPFDRVDRDAHVGGDLLVGFADGEMGQNLPLPVAEGLDKEISLCGRSLRAAFLRSTVRSGGFQSLRNPGASVRIAAQQVPDQGRKLRNLLDKNTYVILRVNEAEAVEKALLRPTAVVGRQVRPDLER